ncbi:MAG: hypothetical protein F6K54_12865 [Okeania sp. SIO3B5]|uniref:DUF7689 domain-containing protein n=1 Tax=Okeania sp. SIO3B5 TaxID=2607811 RepID=UPI0014010897|nr:hypothetical protein [Okeania sp. SIO3B5]NEO53893.1 hypothetical protein [Okeania sp. SIO3B5]
MPIIKKSISNRCQEKLEVNNLVTKVSTEFSNRDNFVRNIIYPRKLTVNNLVIKFSNLPKILRWQQEKVMPEIEKTFPGLSSGNYQVIDGSMNKKYNAVAWAIGEQEKDRWWEPDDLGTYYWPHPVPRQDTLEAYTEVFELHGYSRCPGNNENLERGFEKVAIYCKEGKPLHVARQLPDGQWTSKLGEGQCITHKTLASLEGENFGTVYRVLIRPRRKKNR